MHRTECPTCVALEKAGVTTEEREVCPIEAKLLEVFSGEEGHGGDWQIRRCKACGALYRFRHHYEYDVSGSWDEEYLWRLDDEAAALIAPLLGTEDPAVLDPGLTRALQSQDPQAREAAGVVAWIVAGRGVLLDAAIHAAAVALADHHFETGHFCYRALLTYLRGGPDQARAVSKAVESSGSAAKEKSYSWILEKECREILGH